MHRSAIGIRVHSGWGALVAVAAHGAELDVIERRRAEIVDLRTPGVAQPYHFAERLEINKAQAHVTRCAGTSKNLAVGALQQVISELDGRGYKVARVAILLSSGRPLPTFEKILASHALIHAAEGEFFRQAFRDGAEALKIPVTGIRERELEVELKSTFGNEASRLQKKVAGLGRVLGPPWRADQKLAALAAVIALRALR
jgi:hypothetical protein